MIFDLIYFLGVCFSVITSFMLIFKVNSLRLLSVYLLGAYFFLNGFSMFTYLLIKYEFIIFFPVFYKIPAPITFLIAPIAYLYLRATLNNEKKFRTSDWIHLMPFVIFTINYLPFYFMPYKEKLDLVIRVTQDLNLTYMNQDGLLPEWTNITFRTLLGFVYIILMGRLLYRKFKSSKSNTSRHFTKIMTWLKVFYFSMTGYTVSLVLFYSVGEKVFTNSEEPLSQFIVTIIVSGFFLSLSAYLILHPEVLLGINKSVIDTKQKKIKSIQGIIRSIEEYFERTNYFLDPNCKASNLYEPLNISPRNLSIAISELNFNNFNDYINNLRLNYFLVLLEQDHLTKFDIVGLSTQAGFNSKATFYRVFRERMKMTPNEYIDRLVSKKFA